MTQNFRALKQYKFILIDGLNLANVEFNAKRMLSYQGKPSGMLYGVLKKILSLKKMYRSSEIVFLWDGLSSVRKSWSPEYKAQRPKHDQDFFSSLDVTRKALSLLGITQWTHAGAEADDLCAYFVKKHDDQSILLLTTDKDWFQFVTSNGNVDVMVKNNVYTFEDLRKNLGYPPDRIGIVKIITGDSSDNIKGIERFPSELAARIARQCPNHESILKFRVLSERDSKWRKVIEDNWDRIELNAKVLLTHPEWVHANSLIVVKALSDKKSLEQNRSDLIALLEEYGIKSLNL